MMTSFGNIFSASLRQTSSVLSSKSLNAVRLPVQLTDRFEREHDVYVHVMISYMKAASPFKFTQLCFL
jgi:hypothetical protein